MSEHTTVLIVGASLAGAKAAETLRADGFDGPVILVGEEPVHPYERPPLSKELLRGEGKEGQPFLYPESFYAELGIDLRTGTTVTGIDLSRHVATTDRGTIRFDRLLLATGSEARSLRVPGAELAGVLTLRTLADVARLRDALGQARQVVVVGAGWIGAEVAASARQLGSAVTMVDPLTTPLERVLGPEVGGRYRDLHTAHGVDFRPGVSVTGFAGNTTVEAVRTADGDIPADLVVVGIGARPRTELAEAAGLDVDGGVVVDEHLRASHPDVYAAGDIAAAWHPILGRRIRTEHWSNALNQGIVAGHNLAGTPTEYDKIPTFFSDQYDLGMEYVGHPERWDRVVIRDGVDAGSFLAFWLDEGRVVAAMNANIWDVGSALGDLVRTGARVDPDALADPSIPVEQLAGGAS